MQSASHNLFVSFGKTHVLIFSLVQAKNMIKGLLHNIYSLNTYHKTKISMRSYSTCIVFTDAVTSRAGHTIYNVHYYYYYYYNIIPHAYCVRTRTHTCYIFSSVPRHLPPPLTYRLTMDKKFKRETLNVFHNLYTYI
jgi:hypothetical protein